MIPALERPKFGKHKADTATAGRHGKQLPHLHRLTSELNVNTCRVILSSGGVSRSTFSRTGMTDLALRHSSWTLGCPTPALDCVRPYSGNSFPSRQSV